LDFQATTQKPNKQIRFNYGENFALQNSLERANRTFHKRKSKSPLGLRANMSEVITQRRLRVAGFQGVLDPLVLFLGSFFLGRERMNTQNRHSARAQLCARQKEKLLKL